MPTPLETAQTMVAAHETAITQILLGKSVRFNTGAGDRMCTFEDLGAVRASLADWEAKVTRLTAAQSSAPTFGGLSYSVARFDR